MKATIPYDAEVIQLEITIPFNPDLLVLKVDGVKTTNYTITDNVVQLTNLKKGQVINIYEETPSMRLDGEPPIEVNTYPTLQTMKFRIGSLDYLPIDRDEHPVTRRSE